MSSLLDDALIEARTRFVNARPKSQAIHEEAAKVMPGGNTRTVLYHGPFPLRIVKGDGAYLVDLDGHRYLNLLGEYTAGVFGHSHPAITTALHDAIDQGLNLAGHNMDEARLAKLTTDRFPDIEKVRFCNSGTEANLMAVSTARHVTKRQKVLVFDGGYHGGVLYFGGGGIPINAPFDYVLAPYNDTEKTRSLIQDHGTDLACVLVEPMIGSGGCITGDPTFLKMLRAETAACGAMLICDEVMTSRFWRHGACHELGLEPDLITLGKWIAGGMSFGAFGGRTAIMDIYDPSRPGAMPHAGTFNNNVLSMAGGIAALSDAFTSDIAAHLHEQGDNVRASINETFRRHHAPFQAIGCGSLMNVHPVLRPIDNVDDLKSGDDRLKELLFLDLLERGVYIARRGFIALPLVVSQSEISDFLNMLDDALAARTQMFQSFA